MAEPEKKNPACYDPNYVGNKNKDSSDGRIPFGELIGRVFSTHGAGSIHAKISGHYSSKQFFTNGQTVRQWLSTQSYQAQYDYGIKILKQFGVKP